MMAQYILDILDILDILLWNRNESEKTKPRNESEKVGPTKNQL